MRILCFIDSLGSGGAQRQLVTLGKEFKSRGHNVSFLVYHSEDFYRKELEAAEIQITYIIEGNYIKRLIKIRSFIRNGDFDSVLSFLQAANFMATMAGFPHRKWKLVVGERSANPNIFKSQKLRFYRWFHPFTDFVVANSNANLEIVKKINPYIPDTRLKVIYNVVNNESSSNEIQNIKNENFYLIIGASHRKVKNLNGLIEAVYLLPKEYKERLKVKWFGEKNLDNSYRDGINKVAQYNLHAIFEFHNPIPDIYNEMSNAHAVGLFSHYEGFPNFICEGMALGKPIICTTVSDIPLILKDGENAFLCKPEIPETIAQALMKIMAIDDEHVEIMKESNKAIVETLFDKDTITENYLKLLGDEAS